MIICLQRIARVLFSGSTTNQSIEPLELSLDDAVAVHQPADSLDRTHTNGDEVQRAKTPDESFKVDDLFREDSHHNDSKYRDQDRFDGLLPDSLVASPSVNKWGGPEGEYDKVTSTPLANVSRRQYNEPFLNPNSLHSPFPSSSLSPPTRTPLRALAQSTPKPSISSSTIFDAAQKDGSRTKGRDNNLLRGTHVLTDSPSPSCEKALFQAVRDVTCHASEGNCRLDASNVTFGSPSRSFELAMAREADKLCPRAERDSRTSGLGMFCFNINSFKSIIQPLVRLPEPRRIQHCPYLPPTPGAESQAFA